MNRNITFTPGEYYHIYNRGVNKDKIFYSKGDWDYFHRLIFLRNDAEGHIRPNRLKNKKLSQIEDITPLVNIQAYVLMPNHYHLLLSEIEPGGITTYMKRLSTSFSMYMNTKYDRSGPLMCRPFRAKHITDDAYMRWVISYIHLNPVEYLESNWMQKGIMNTKKIQASLLDYQYCSYRDYYGEPRDESVILNKSSLPFFISDLEDPQHMFSMFQNKEGEM